MSRSIEILAHRGGALEAPENTLKAFRRALALGVDGIECDVQALRDGVVLVHHDSDLATAPAAAQRTPLCKLTQRDLAEIDLGWTHGERFAGQKPPTLSELLDLPWRDQKLMIEVKADHEPSEIGALVGKLVARHRAKRLCWVGSFSPLALRSVHRNAKDVRLLAIAEKEADLETFEDLPLSAWAIDRKIADAALIARGHEKSLEVWSWTVKSREQARSLATARIDAWITDTPADLMGMRSDPKFGFPDT